MASVLSPSTNLAILYTALALDLGSASPWRLCAFGSEPEVGQSKYPSLSLSLLISNRTVFQKTSHLFFFK